LENALVEFIEWFLLFYGPPMVGNSAPVLLAGRHPVDGGRLWRDGRPILGPGKTWEGLIIGVYLAWASAILLYYYFGDPMVFIIGLVGGVSALVGDMIGSFIKRRLGLKRGDPFPIVDQLDFALMASIVYWPLSPLFRRIDFISYSLLIILVLHVATNNIAFYLGVKDRRW
jgi:CDP-2,3-bis-(O-geranylgeranyl)-sn-glycerol synthase